VAATLETAARGVIYEHTPQSPPAQALATELKTMLAQMREQGAKVFDREAAIVLRAIEQGARGSTAPTDSATGYVDLVARLLDVTGTSEAVPQAAPPSPLILP
jgi:hypothetical protein